MLIGVVSSTDISPLSLRAEAYLDPGRTLRVRLEKMQAKAATLQGKIDALQAELGAIDATVKTRVEAKEG